MTDYDLTAQCYCRRPVPTTPAHLFVCTCGLLYLWNDREGWQPTSTFAPARLRGQRRLVWDLSCSCGGAAACLRCVAKGAAVARPLLRRVATLLHQVGLPVKASVDVAPHVVALVRDDDHPVGGGLPYRKHWREAVDEVERLRGERCTLERHLSWALLQRSFYADPQRYDMVRGLLDGEGEAT